VPLGGGTVVVHEAVKLFGMPFVVGGGGGSRVAAVDFLLAVDAETPAAYGPR
jgi:hypothetical protein